MGWTRRVLVAVDQLGNAIAGGNPDATISARTGYFVKETSGPKILYWQLLEKVIDYTFMPVDGPHHCLNAYLSDSDERYRDGSDFFRGVLGIIIIGVCVPLSILIRIGVILFPSTRYQPQA